MRWPWVIPASGEGRGFDAAAIRKMSGNLVSQLPPSVNHTANPVRHGPLTLIRPVGGEPEIGGRFSR